MSSYLLAEAPRILLPTLAVAMGDRGALFLQQVYYWCEYHRRARTANHYQEGQWWTYNTVQGWREQFPFWSERTIRRIIRRLEELGVLRVGNFNRARYDRTLWYAVDVERVEALVAALAPASQEVHAAGRSQSPGRGPVERPGEPDERQREPVDRQAGDLSDPRPADHLSTGRRATERPDRPAQDGQTQSYRSQSSISKSPITKSSIPDGQDGRNQADPLSPCKRTDGPDARGQGGQLEADGLPEPIPKRSQELAPEVDRAWSLTLQELELQMTRQTFDTWVKPLVLIGLDPEPVETVARPDGSRRPDCPSRQAYKASIRCPNDYSRAWCEGRLGVRLSRALGGILDAPVEIVYQVG